MSNFLTVHVEAMKTYFNIRYLFDRNKVHHAIAERLDKPGSDYICVADGVIMTTVNRNQRYRDVVNGGMFSICDSSYVPLYIKWLYGDSFPQYCGSQIFMDIVSEGKYRMIFLGAQQAVLDGLRRRLSQLNPEVEKMQFVELPFCNVEDFDYPAIARMVEDDGADIVWIALGAPKQEYFMAHLKPHLRRGVMIAVGAAFKFFSDTDVSRAPQWMVDHHLEFLHRISQEPKKQVRRCFNIIVTLPMVLAGEWRRKAKINRR